MRQHDRVRELMTQSSPYTHFVEFNGDCWQSVFPVEDAPKSQLHTDVEDAIEYMTKECGVPRNSIYIIPKQEDQHDTL